MIPEIWIIEYNSESNDVLDKRSWYVGKLVNSTVANYKKLLTGGSLTTWIIVGFSTNRDDAESLRDDMIRNIYNDWNKQG